MKKQLFVFIFIFFASCTKKEDTDLSNIQWIQKFNFQTNQVYKVSTTGIVPAPKIPFTIEGITKNSILALGTYDLILNEEFFDLKNFEPYRLTNRQISTKDMLLEEGIADSLKIFNTNFDGIRTYLIKKSDSQENFAAMIGWQFFQSQLLIIDMDNNLLGMKDCDNSDFDGVDFYTSENPVNGNNMLKFQCVLNGQTVTASISTSIRHTYISPEFLINNNIDFNKDYSTLDSLRIGNVVFRDFTCFINKDQLLLEPDNKKPINLIIGLNLIKKHPLIIDFCKNKLGFSTQ